MSAWGTSWGASWGLTWGVYLTTDGVIAFRPIFGRRRRMR